MGFGKGSSTTTVEMTPEQRELLRAQTGALTGTFLPAYQSTIGGAGSVYNQVAPILEQVANTALGSTGRMGQLQEQTGAGALTEGLTGLSNLFSGDYKTQQIQAAMQPAREAIREQLSGQNAMYGAAGGAGSARQALADTNLRQLGEQRLATAAAQASADVENRRAVAAQQLASFGQQGLNAAANLAAMRTGLAQSPQDAYSKYASVIYGVPQASTTPQFQGTQGGTTTGKGFSASIPR